MLRRFTPSRRATTVCAAAFAGAMLLAACGGDDDGTAAPDGTTAALDPAAARGQELAQDNGCRSCHQDKDGLGPTWNGLYGSTVTLDDGTTLTADDDYLARSISDPGADKVEGFGIAMPTYDNLDENEIADIIAYIRTLA